MTLNTKEMMMNNYPRQQGLYDPAHEHDACGVGLLVNVNGAKSHHIVEKGLQVLEHMVHRGAEGADPLTGDGAGIMLQIPHEFILLQGIPVPEKGRYGTGLVFLPKDEILKENILGVIRQTVIEEHLDCLSVREVPVNSEILGEGSRAAEPSIVQLFVTEADGKGNSELSLDFRLYVLRKKIENRVAELYPDALFYVVSLSTKNIIYKGMLTSEQLRLYYPDLTNPYLTSGIALVHSRFSTNTFPSWPLAQPFRMLGHNGEINTIRGNRRWMEARESVLSPVGVDMKSISPIVQPGMSDSASLDNVLEFFTQCGMSIPHALAMLVPQSSGEKEPLSPELKSFYEYHSILMEPWDGPATLLFSDGRYAGGTLDRNGLRPARYLVTKNDMVVIASEMGTLPFEAVDVKEKGRLSPGKIMLIDTENATIMHDDEVKEMLSKMQPYGEWLSKNRVKLENISSGRTASNNVHEMDRKLRLFGYSKEDLQTLILPMTKDSAEPTGSMGNDTPLAVFSQKPQSLFNYFRQQFAQVTNPPIDPIREELVMSLESYIGVIGRNLLQPQAEHCKMVHLQTPILTNRELDLLSHLSYKGFRTQKIDMLYPVAEGAKGMEQALEALCEAAAEAVGADFNYLILSDKGASETMAPIPSLLALAAVHNTLIEKRRRVQTALIVETGEAREVMHAALLVGYGASAIVPYMVYGLIDSWVKSGEVQLDYPTAEKHYIKGMNKGLLKVFSKMGISTLGSYKGAQLFESVGVSTSILNKYFGGTISKIEGVGFEEMNRDIMRRIEDMNLSEGEGLVHEGQYAFRKEGEYHAWNPETIATLQLATRLGSYKKFKEYSSLVNDKEQLVFLRDLMQYKKAKKAIPLEEVESVESITRRFVTGAMSFGSISKEAHEAMAIAMNKLGGKSNTGEGGEDAERFQLREDGSSARSAIKQVASGRFGVTTEYLVNADEIQIKVAQGAKPGEGGQLPGFKVDEVIAKTRHSIPGISLISPPPHHDIYSIEDLAQLIYDLRSVNPKARISVKLVAESGVGTIAAGVAKAKADAIIISGCEGGTGASPMSSIRHAGLPSEIGLSETQQTLVLNGLRGRVAVQVDGQLKTGRDIIIQALLGADEFGFATSALIVLGCVMMRKCHLNTCPMGVATQDEVLRKRFLGRSEYLVNFFTYLAEEVREILAEMGFRSLDDIIGRVDLLERRATKENAKWSTVDLDKLLYNVSDGVVDKEIRTGCSRQNNVIEENLNTHLVKAASSAINTNLPMELHYRIGNTDRSVGATLSGVIAAKKGNAGLADDTIRCTFNGTAGQSFGAFLSKGISFKLEGDANDYVGKGLSGGRIVIVPPVGTTFEPHRNSIAGNTLMYGATSGEVFINGRVGERFCVRNSGATAVVEGTGDHCCEYMTGGTVVVLGTTGRNFAAGMSGGIAYVWNKDGHFDERCNMEMVELSLIEDITDDKDLRLLIQHHFNLTQSPLAETILSDWNTYRDQFIKVMPIEYKKVLHERKARELQQKIEKVQRDY